MTTITNGIEVTDIRAAVDSAVIVTMGLDQHADQVTVCRQIGGRVPQPSQKLQEDQLLKMVVDHVMRGHRVYTCYEAGPCGYGLHRKLEAAGAINFVVAAQRWDERGRRVKTDRRDAFHLWQRLARYVAGDGDAFSVVRVPTPRQEQVRALCRQRATLLKERQRCELRGHGLALTQGIDAPSRWWQAAEWRAFAPQLPPWLREHLQRWQVLAAALQQQVDALTPRIEALSAGERAPKGLGAMTYVLLLAEVLDWGRFHNRREPGSYSGLCPSEDSTGHQRRQGSVNKHGNPRVRQLLVEAVWRMIEWQPDYPPMQRVAATRPGSRARKRAIVATARRLMVDLWRLYTGRQTPEQLHLCMTDL